MRIINFQVFSVLLKIFTWINSYVPNKDSFLFQCSIKLKINSRQRETHILHQYRNGKKKLILLIFSFFPTGTFPKMFPKNRGGWRNQCQTKLIFNRLNSDKKRDTFSTEDYCFWHKLFIHRNFSYKLTESISKRSRSTSQISEKSAMRHQETAAFLPLIVDISWLLLLTCIVYYSNMLNIYIYLMMKIVWFPWTEAESSALKGLKLEWKHKDFVDSECLVSFLLLFSLKDLVNFI